MEIGDPQKIAFFRCGNAGIGGRVTAGMGGTNQSGKQIIPAHTIGRTDFWGIRHVHEHMGIYHRSLDVLISEGFLVSLILGRVRRAKNARLTPAVVSETRQIEALSHADCCAACELIVRERSA